MKFSELGKILYFARFAADVSIDSIAKQSRTSPRRAHEIIHNALEQGFIKPYWIVNPFLLGFKQYTFHLEIPPKCEAQLREFICARGTRQIVKHVTWAAAVQGEYNFHISLIVRDDLELLEFFDQLSQVTTIIKKFWVANMTFELYAPRFISPVPHKAVSLAMGIKRKLINVDEIDLLILRTLSIRPQISNRDLASYCNCSPSKISRRLSKLREKEILVASSYLINSAAFGLHSYKLLISLSSLSRTQISTVRSYIAEERSIAYVIRTIGAWDFEIGIEVRSYSQALEHLEICKSYLGNYCTAIQLVEIKEDLISRPFPF